MYKDYVVYVVLATMAKEQCLQTVYMICWDSYVFGIFLYIIYVYRESMFGLLGRWMSYSGTYWDV